MREELEQGVGDVAVAVEHVGSTAVPGLAAKPIIDLDVVVRSSDDVPTAVRLLESLGYRHEGDLGVPGREAFLAIGAPLLQRYERMTFDKELVSVPGKPLAEFVCPGHPLLEVTVDVLIERNRSLLKQGAVLIDDLDPSAIPRLLVYLEHSIQDARSSFSGERTIVSERFEFVEIQEDDVVRLAGYAPYQAVPEAGYVV